MALQQALSNSYTEYTTDHTVGWNLKVTTLYLASYALLVSLGYVALSLTFLSVNTTFHSSS